MNPFDLRAAATSLGAVALCAAVTSGACGGEASVIAAKGPADDLSSADGALAALDHAEAELGRALGAQPGFADAPAASSAPMATSQHPSQQSSPPPPPPQPPVAPRPAAPSPAAAASPPREEREHEAPAAPTAPADPCATACSALRSMERATAHLCGLADPGDRRCEEARTRVMNAATRVHSACPTCAR